MRMNDLTSFGKGNSTLCSLGVNIKFQHYSKTALDVYLPSSFSYRVAGQDQVPPAPLGSGCLDRFSWEEVW